MASEKCSFGERMSDDWYKGGKKKKKGEDWVGIEDLAVA